ncbi:hypothetical protein CHARACLAT_014307 [Characodon lateralis]|uniref:Secreted protein n=1 Tax=Characodon lateralis TaxID=208331 RepID=A0ABU7F3Z1_9TELE|nr:hypothetical protein [Characodon lateralis]
MFYLSYFSTSTISTLAFSNTHATLKLLRQCYCAAHAQCQQLRWEQSDSNGKPINRNNGTAEKGDCARFNLFS